MCTVSYLKKSIIIIIIALLVVATLLVSLYYLLPIIGIANAEKVLKAQLDNPYIDASYKDWNSSNFPRWNNVRLPGEWVIDSDSSIIQITDECGEIIALAAVIGPEDAPFCTREEFLSVALSQSITTFSMNHDSRFTAINGSSFGTITAIGADELSFYYLSLVKHSTPELLFVFPELNETDLGDILEISQAIAFSVHFPCD